MWRGLCGCIRRKWQRKMDDNKEPNISKQNIVSVLVLWILILVVIGSTSLTGSIGILGLILVSFVLLVASLIIITTIESFSSPSLSQQESKPETHVAKMSGADYEKYCANWLLSYGFRNIQMTPASGDYGADIIAINKAGKWVLQCKRYTGKVPIKAVQEIIGAKVYYKANQAAICTNSELTPNAKKLAETSGVVVFTIK